MIDIVPFDKHQHKREGFDCGEPELNDYLLRQISQDMRKQCATPFVAVETGIGRILGYYTLSPSAVFIEDIPEKLLKTISKYRKIPSILLGRLAVDRTTQNQGLGAELMADAIVRSLDIPLRWPLIEVDAKDEKATAFYTKFGFLPLLNDVKHLYARREELENFVTKTRTALSKEQQPSVPIAFLKHLKNHGR